MRVTEGYPGSIVRAALGLTAPTVVRPDTGSAARKSTAPMRNSLLSWIHHKGSL